MLLNNLNSRVEGVSGTTGNGCANTVSDDGPNPQMCGNLAIPNQILATLRAQRISDSHFVIDSKGQKQDYVAK